ncbi:unnamed protein product [Litomosoides sigmodontis]|uniref:Uncharacterized protein n=1 Tax=Litomosoides sigmodontis TaxID=42156 RepID=A0A3P6V9G2_LITSI|nr:unnamed protein product [Litomosoides sigmodontis]
MVELKRNESKKIIVNFSYFNDWSIRKFFSAKKNKGTEENFVYLSVIESQRKQVMAAESESSDCKVEQENAWQELRRTMECLSDQPFQIMFIKGNASSDYFQPHSEFTQSENTTQLDLRSSSNLRTASDGFGENSRNVSDLDLFVKIPSRSRASRLQNSNIAELNNIFHSDTRKTIELSAHCREVIHRELTFWHDRLQYEMKQTNEIIANLYARMERIKGLNRELRDILTYFNDDTDSSITSPTR